MRLEEVLERIRKGEDLTVVLKDSEWQTFEKLVSFIFENHDFQTKVHFRFSRNGRRYEIDVLAERYGKKILVECKKVRKGFTEGFIEKVVEQHEEKVRMFKEKYGGDVVSVIVTLLDIDIYKKNSTYVVPVYKLNSFILFL